MSVGEPVHRPVSPEAPLRYQQPARLTEAAGGQELLHLRVRYKLPEEAESRLLEQAVLDDGSASAGDETRFAAAVAAFGMLLRDTPPARSLTWEDVRTLALGSVGPDPGGHRRRFVELIDVAAGL